MRKTYKLDLDMIACHGTEILGSRAANLQALYGIILHIGFLGYLASLLAVSAGRYAHRMLPMASLPRYNSLTSPY